MSFHKNLRGKDLHAPSTEFIENNTGATLTKLSVVAFNNMGTAFPQVQLANPSLYKNFGIVQEDILDGKHGHITCLGFMFNINTSPWLVGSLLYSDGAGQLSNTPNGAAVAIVNRQDATKGVLYVIAVTGTNNGTDSHAWDVDGNDGLSGTNFIGTRDAAPLKFRTNNLPVGQFDINGRLAIGAQDPKAALHIKSFPGYSGAGLQVDTFALTSDQPALVPCYAITMTNGSVVRVKFTVTARQSDGSQRASFTRSGLFYKEGGNVLVEGHDWASDFTVKSVNGFDIGYTLGTTDITFQVQNANSIDTYWSGHVEIESIGSST